jgi:hypothetical protein
MVLFLSLLTGLCWIIAYIKLIHLGFKEKTYGMPFIALTLNFTWEAIQSYLNLKNNLFNVETFFILIWFLLDILIVLTYLIYGKRYFPKHTNEEYFMPWTLIIFIMSFVIQYFFIIEFGDSGKLYSAFIQNLIMSILFIIMLAYRTDIKGQSLTIAISKWIGTLAPTISFGIIFGNELVLILGIFCCIFDIIYIYFLNHVKKLHSNLAKYSINKVNSKSQN